MYKCAVASLGCKVNQCEADALKERMGELGYEIVDFFEKADVYIINTCCVTAEGERKSRQTVRKVQNLNKEAVICVTGCAAQRAPEVFKSIVGVSIVCGNSQKHMLPQMIKEKLDDIFVDDMSRFSTYQDMPDSTSEKTRAFIKIQDGCNNFCSYCIIPYVRGRERSRNLDSIIFQCKELSKNGFKEIVINGIHLSSYGKEWDFKPDLADVVEKVCQIDGIERVRLGSLEPNVVTDEFLEKVTRHKEFCRQYHLSLQSGSNRVLKRMNRKYTVEDYFRAVERIRNNYNLSAISTDIITGFPGETEDEYNETIAFQDKIGFAWVHVFPYSVREGTVAEKMSCQLEKEVKARRARILSEKCRKNGEKYRKNFVGEIKTVLCETNENNVQQGLTEEHISVFFESAPIENEFVKVKITSVTNDGLKGERID